MSCSSNIHQHWNLFFLTNLSRIIPKQHSMVTAWKFHSSPWKSAGPQKKRIIFQSHHFSGVNSLLNFVGYTISCIRSKIPVFYHDLSCFFCFLNIHIYKYINCKVGFFPWRNPQAKDSLHQTHQTHPPPKESKYHMRQTASDRWPAHVASTKEPSRFFFSVFRMYNRWFWVLMATILEQTKKSIYIYMYI